MWAARSCRTRPAASVLPLFPVSPFPRNPLDACRLAEAASPRNRITPKPNYNPHLALRRLDLREDRGGDGVHVAARMFAERTSAPDTSGVPTTIHLVPSPSPCLHPDQHRKKCARCKRNESVRRHTQVMLLLMCICCSWLLFQCDRKEEDGVQGTGSAENGQLIELNDCHCLHTGGIDRSISLLPEGPESGKRREPECEL